MTSDWAFLEPWHAALCASFIQKLPMDSGSEMQVSFEWSFVHGHSQHKCYLMIHLEEGNPQNMIQLKMIREAIELFTVLSVVNNKVFTERFSQLMQSMDQRRCYPKWNLYVSGDAVVHQDTWSRFFEVLDPSPPISWAIQMLKARGLDDTDKENIFSCYGVEWTCKFGGADVYATLMHDKETDTFNGIKVDLRTFFNAGVPLIIQLGLTPNSAAQVDIWQDLRQQVPMCVYIFITIRDLTAVYSRDLAAGLAQTPINSFDITFDEKSKTSDVQATINAGIIVSRAYDWYRVVTDDDMQFTCKKVSNSVFAAICSTIAVRSHTGPISFYIDSVGSESWPWLANVICCGISVDIRNWKATLTKSDLLGIADVFRYNFPHSASAAPELRSRRHTASQFGFVEILNGTAVLSVEERGAPAFVMPSSIRCRAWFKEYSIVEVVVPGFGRCETQIGDGVFEVSRDLEGQSAPMSRALHSLCVFFTAIESVSLAINLLELLGRNLRSLTLGIPSHSNDLPLDLSVLSALCPNLRFLEIHRCGSSGLLLPF